AVWPVLAAESARSNSASGCGAAAGSAQSSAQQRSGRSPLPQAQVMMVSDRGCAGFTLDSIIFASGLAACGDFTNARSTGQADTILAACKSLLTACKIDLARSREVASLVKPSLRGDRAPLAALPALRVGTGSRCATACTL